MEYKAPVNVSVTYTSSQQQVAVQWDPPVYEQTVYWGENNAMYQITLNKTIPFYFGQMWSKNDIRLFHKKTITSVKFIPIRDNTYEIYIVQGKRTYRQQVVSPVTGQTNTIRLDTPFVINSEEDLYVSFYTLKLSADNYPAVCDGGPAVQGKGNIYSFDGKTWLNLYDDIKNPDEFNYNFFVAAVVSSIEKEIPVEESNQSSRSTLAAKSTKSVLRIASLPEEITIRSIRPAAFPEATGYYIYRDNVRIASVPPIPRRYLDKTPSTKTNYQVSAVYNGVEGQKSASVSIDPVSNLPVEPNDILLYPNIFTNQVNLRNHELVSRIEVYSATGMLVLQVDKPDSIIHTGSLQPGIYFFRIYTVYKELIVIRGVKR
jgi:hypothetical protein